MCVLCRGGPLQILGSQAVWYYFISLLVCKKKWRHLAQEYFPSLESALTSGHSALLYQPWWKIPIDLFLLQLYLARSRGYPMVCQLIWKIWSQYVSFFCHVIHLLITEYETGFRSLKLPGVLLVNQQTAIERLPVEEIKNYVTSSQELVIDLGK